MAKNEWAKKKLEKMDAGGGGGGDFYDWKDGANIVRVLPSWKGEGEQFYAEDGIHYKIGPNGERVKCRKLIGKPCAVCEQSDKAYKAGDKDGAKKFRAKSRYYANAIDLGDPKSGVKTLAFGASVLKQILTYLVDEDEEWGEWWHAKGRYDFKIVKKGEDLNTEYTVFPTRKYVDVKTPDAEPKDLDALASKLPSYEEQKAILLGEDPPEESEEEPEEEEEPAPKKSLKKGKPVEEEEEATEEEAEEEPEAEEEAEEEPEEEEATEEEAEEEEATEEEESEEEAPACFQDPNEHNPADSICKDCSFFAACGKAVKKKIAAEPKKYKNAPLAKAGEEEPEEEVEKELRKAVKKPVKKLIKKGSRK